ncbi:TetR/AcrR family transcriptional regulator [Streptomyces sp. A7024]|uniref:TetR/AcrR family transcriptional regulator n=1 Tax=Streptomyces coryli TaxID=1128680 RepID=A0A6G4U4U4_9ACTN|nr:TetR/AcrR family transcriptional regulator [Streptomyces coryli]NGN67194.1 TetR/AcrR family transcriptional regulator [Streptomyces coryli]
MTSTDTPRRGAEKRQAVLEGALTVFARDGYTRAGIDTIAKEAGVSTRTIYNHFTDKARLFEDVILYSANRVAEAQLAILERHLRKVTDIEQDLIDFGLEWHRRDPAQDRHFALIRHLNADVDHIPPPAIEAWQEAGPLRVFRAFADWLAGLADRGLLRVPDPERAALHLTQLTSPQSPSFRARQPTDAEITESVRAGVHAFLHGYGAN